MGKKRREILKRNIRAVNVETRETETGGKTIEGLIPYNKESEDMGFREILEPGCFKKTISEARIVALWNHNADKVLGNNKAGTLELTDGPEGLRCVCTLPNTSYATDAYEAIRSGNVTTMSFAFSAIIDEWNLEENTRTIKEAKLYEVSFGVPFPAYEDTESQARSLVLEKRGIDLDSLEDVLTKDVLDENDKVLIRSTLAQLSTLVVEKTHEEPPDALPAASAVDRMLMELETL